MNILYNVVGILHFRLYVICTCTCKYSYTPLVSFFKIQIYYITFGGLPHHNYSSLAWSFFTSIVLLRDLIFGTFQNSSTYFAG